MGPLTLMLPLLALLGCEPRGERVPAVILDPSVVEAENGSAIQTFDGAPTALELGTGWHAAKTRKGKVGTTRVAWAGRNPLLYFARPEGRDLELSARCAPQRRTPLDPALNGVALPRLVLEPGWQTIRVPLPEESLVPGWNALQMKYTARIAPAPASAPRKAPRVAECDLIVVGPAGASFEKLLADAPRAEPAERTLVLRGGAGAALPVPSGRRIELEIEKLPSPEQTARLSISLRSPSASVRELWSGTVTQGSRQKVSFEAPAPGFAQLLLSPRDSPRGRPAEDLPLLLDLRPSTRSPPSKSHASHPHVFLYVIDTLRADSLGVYGSARPTSPRIDRFAREAVLFEHAWSGSSWTLPGTVSLLTGLHPRRHGYLQLGRADERRSELPWLPERLRSLGYDTLAISQTNVVSPTQLVDSGFQRFFVNDLLGRQETDSSMVRRILWTHLLHRPNPVQPLFVYVHTVEPHAPYVPRGADRAFAEDIGGSLAPNKYEPRFFARNLSTLEPKEVERLRALYDGEVAQADRAFGAFVDLLDYLGLYEDSILILSSDHGEEFAEHAGFDHGRTLFEELLHVPLLVKFPGSRHGGKRVAMPVSTVDVAATILELVGRDAPNQPLDGASLLPLVEGSTESRPLFADTKASGIQGLYAEVDQSAALLEDVKCIHSGNGIDRLSQPMTEDQAFDLAQDPEERRALHGSSAARRRCVELLAKRNAEVLPAEKRTVSQEPALEIDEEARDRLRALGYLE